MTYKSLKMIAVSEENYLKLKKLGRTGDSFNDVITGILKQRCLHTGPSGATNSVNQNANTDTTRLDRDHTEYE